MKRNLDDQAKIFSLSYNKKDTSIFRVEVNFTNNIDEKYLQQASSRTLKKYKDFKVKLSRNIFWYYLEDNNLEVPIHKKIDYKFKKINNEENNYYLFKISYENKKLVVDFFHLLTDGMSAKEFIKDLIHNYLRLNDHSLTPQEKTPTSAENAYERYYTKQYNKVDKIPQSYQLKGEYIPTKEVSFNDIFINLEELKKVSKEKDCTLSEFLISLIVYSLYETNYKKYKGNKPINVCIPVSLKKYFNTDTITNFVSHAMLSINPTDNFDNLLSLVRREYTHKVDKLRIQDTFESNGKAINNKLLNIIPLPIKRFIVILGSYIVKRRFTITYSNLGEITLIKGYDKYIEDISFRLIPDWAERIRCGVSSYNGKLNISFGSNLLDNAIELKLISLLEKYNISYTIKDNKITPLNLTK